MRIQHFCATIICVCLIGALFPESARAALQVEYTSSTGAGAGNAPDSHWSSNVAIDQSPQGTLFIGGKQDSGAYGLGGSSNSGEPVSTLTLSGLPAFSNGTISFTLYIIQSWDGWSNGADSPDIFNVEMGGTNPTATSGRIIFTGGTRLFSNDFSQVPGTFQDYPAPQGSAATNAPGSGSVATNTLGYPFMGDATYQIGQTFGVGAGGTVTFEFYKDGSGDQITSDESFGLNNVSVSVNTVPEPASLSLLTLWGFGAVGGRRRNGNR